MLVVIMFYIVWNLDQFVPKFRTDILKPMRLEKFWMKGVEILLVLSWVEYPNNTPNFSTFFNHFLRHAVSLDSL